MTHCFNMEFLESFVDVMKLLGLSKEVKAQSLRLNTSFDETVFR